MTILPIFLCNNEILRGKATLCQKPYSKYAALAENMIQTMYKAPGVGLAAPQIGMALRMFVYDAGAGGMALINPEIISYSEETCEYEEGCLSVPEINARVVRPASIKFRAFDLDGYRIEREAGELEARVIQHEYDHLDGILFIDRVSEKDRKIIFEKLKKIGLKGKVV
ncbi:MAG TPA: peptide deformylase [Candidatus Wallbacteria bacterium]|nr:peptide deformylase [Candidatus Wallbacteria bacterium]